MRRRHLRWVLGAAYCGACWESPASAGSARLGKMTGIAVAGHRRAGRHPPTKTEQADLALYGRNGESLVAVLAPRSGRLL